MQALLPHVRHRLINPARKLRILIAKFGDINLTAVQLGNEGEIQTESEVISFIRWTLPARIRRDRNFSVIEGCHWSGGVCSMFSGNSLPLHAIGRIVHPVDAENQMQDIKAPRNRRNDAAPVQPRTEAPSRI